MQAVPQLIGHVREQMNKVIIGQREMVDQCIVVMLCGGHALLEGVPGIAKTLTVKALSQLIQLGFQRVQCTSDLMPADVVGTNVLNLSSSQFQFHQGPVFTDLLLVDEINRMPPRTQAALLECMEERQITVDGERHQLSSHFTVFATQNPIEFEGTYPLPEAQLDRFLLKILVSYPREADEVGLLAKVHQGFDSHRLKSVDLQPVTTELLDAAQAELLTVSVQDALFAYLVKIVRKTRDWPSVSLGASPRAAINLLRVSQAMASIDGRDYVIPDDVKSAALPVLRHRIMLKPEAELEGLNTDQILKDVLRAVEVPK
jgi:MoxR-like ATPase